MTLDLSKMRKIFHFEIKSFTFTESGGRYDLDQEKYYFEPWNVFINKWLNAEVSL